ncbi:MAG TPA: hypothetical protein VGS41_13915, partial [Chthonomonadales bacterium]|nr:hypothetical protein [Chthonomonadales bacterium]
MGEQEMQFADPDWKPLAQRQTQSGDVAAFVPQPVNSRAYDAGNTGQPATSYEQGYRGPLRQEQTPYVPLGAQQMATPPAANTRRRSRWWVWVIILIVIFSIINGANHSSSSYGPGSYPGPYYGRADAGQQTTSFDLANASLVHITDWADSIQLQQGDPSSHQVVVQSDTANTDQPQEAMDGSTLTITVSPAQGGNTIIVTLP